MPGLVIAGALGCRAPERPSGSAVIASGADLEGANPLVTVHPLSRQVQRYVLFVTLAKFDSILTPVPYFARSWTWSPDRRTLTMRLVGDLRWHDGPPVTANDVRFTIEAARDPATGYARAQDLATIDSVHAQDDTTVVLLFSQSQAAIAPIFCELPILPEHLLANVPRTEFRRSPFNTSPVGAGPFRFAGRVAGQRWRFDRNADFPADMGGPPILSRLTVAVVDEPTTKFAGLVSGELDLAGIPPTVASLAERDPSLRVISYPVLFVTAVVFNTTRPPFDDARVRAAVSLALDRDRIVRVALAGYGLPAGGPIPPDDARAFRDSLPLRDTARADQLLDASGWKRRADGLRTRAGKLFEIELLTVGSGDNAIEQLVQADLRARGIRAEIRQLELGAFLTRARAKTKDFDALVTGIPGDIGLSYIGAMFDSRLAGGALDYSGFHTPALDALLEHARAAPDASSSLAAWQQVQSQLVSDMPVAWIYHSRGVQGASRRLTGATMDLRGELATVARWSVQPPRE